jgi:hypothetical protein
MLNGKGRRGREGGDGESEDYRCFGGEWWSYEICNLKAQSGWFTDLQPWVLSLSFSIALPASLPIASLSLIRLVKAGKALSGSSAVNCG